MASDPGPARRRLPRSVVVAWAIAGVVIAGLVAAVVSLLGSSSHQHMNGMNGMNGMDGTGGTGFGVGEAFTRGRSATALPALDAGRLLTAWQLDSVAVAVVVIVAAAYLTGVALVPVREQDASWPVRHTVLFFLGLAVVVYATNGSIAVYDQALFSAHMAGHLALVMVAPALLVAGRPLALAVAASSPPRRTRIERAARGRIAADVLAPPVALATYALVIVGSHLSGVMDVVMRNTWAGQIEHLVYLIAGVQFFVLVIGAEPIRWCLASPARWLLLAIAMAVDTFTGIVLMQGTQPVELVRSGFGVDALADTHTGGAIMWFAGDAIMLVIMVGLVVQWLRAAGTAPAERSWLEQARGSVFAEHTSSAVDTVDDEDDAARQAYNEWLGRLAERR